MTQGSIPLILSGMSSMEQLKENIGIFSKEDLMTDLELGLLSGARNKMAKFLPCTNCGYCMGACPASLDIPKLLSLCNEVGFESSWSVNALMRAMKDAEKPSACTACGACSALCPQNIDIPDELAKLGSAT
jgi:hypothetical protein